MAIDIYSIQIRVLIYREGREFVARALEMDLIGYGKTEREAVEELRLAIEAQVSFAHQSNDSSMIQFPADREYFERWEAAQAAALMSQVFPDKSTKLPAKAIFLTFTQAKLKTLRERRFSRQPDLVCA